MNSNSELIKIIVMSANQHKICEIRDIFKSLNCDVFSFSEFYKNTLNIEENGTTFEENAKLKVNALKSEANTIFLADDSGLEVEILSGRPGIHSARYAGKNSSTKDLCQKLLQEMSGKKNRTSNFTTVIALKFPDAKIETVTGKVSGTITNKMSGTNGFGYDPVFQPDGFDQTFAQMNAKDKNKISHRFIALQKARIKIDKYIKNFP